MFPYSPSHEKNPSYIRVQPNNDIIENNIIPNIHHGDIQSFFFASLNSKLPYSNKIKFSFGLYIVFILQNVESLFQLAFTNKFDYFNKQ